MSVRIGDDLYNVFRMIVEFALEGLLAFIYKKRQRVILRLRWVSKIVRGTQLNIHSLL